MVTLHKAIKGTLRVDEDKIVIELVDEKVLMQREMTYDQAIVFRDHLTNLLYALFRKG